MRHWFRALTCTAVGLLIGGCATTTIPVAGQPHENSLGMRFVPVPGTNVLFSIGETRVRDFEVFASATGHRADGKIWTWIDGKRGNYDGFSWRNPGFTQGPTHPVCAVSWDDAQAFCRWLTQKERAEGRLEPTQRYRLPTDAEWSAAVGLPNEPGATPADKHEAIRNVYPWGTQYPPQGSAGNYGDFNWDNHGEMAAYNDGYKFTAPVGSYAANRHGLYDLGNAAEWCEDEYLPGGNQHVLRGASFRRGGGSADVLSSHRGRAESGPDNRYAYHGFRVVLAVGSAR